MDFKKLIDKTRSFVNSVRYRNEYVPFNVEELEGMLGKEFYVAVFSNRVRNRFVQTLSDSDKPKRSFPYGSIIEVNPNKDEKVKGYLLSDLSKITFGGKPAADTFDDYVAVEHFMMRLSNVELYNVDQIHINGMQTPSLSGLAAKYDVDRGMQMGAKEEMKVIFDRNPNSKTKMYTVNPFYF